MEKVCPVKYLVAEPVQELKFAAVYEDTTPVRDFGDCLLYITDVRQIGPTSLLLKWETSPDVEIDGYKVYLGGEVKSKVFSKSRKTTVIDGLSIEGPNTVKVYATWNNERREPPACTSFNLSS